MHLLSLVADRLWLVSEGTVKPYDGDLESYRELLLSRDRPQKKNEPVKTAEKPKKLGREAMAALRGEVKKGEQRIEKLNEMRDKLATKLADPSLYETERKGEIEVWQKKYAEVMEGLDRAEALWLSAMEKLETAQSAGS